MDHAAQCGSRGAIVFRDPASIDHGFATVTRAVSASAFAYSGDRPRRWAAAEEPWLHGFWKHLWCDQHIRAVAIDTTNRTVTLAQPPEFGLDPGQPYYAENLVEEITRPGEWYLNRATGILYFWPPARMEDADIRVSTLATPLWRMSDASNIVVRNLTFVTGRAELVVVTGGASNRLTDCSLLNAAPGRAGSGEPAAACNGARSPTPAAAGSPSRAATDGRSRRAAIASSTA